MIRALALVTLAALAACGADGAPYAQTSVTGEISVGLNR